jgi:hypothetical protein
MSSLPAVPTTIAQLFAKDISRPINGVVKADQTDEVAAWQELDEYVVTKELSRHFRGFFDAYLRSVDHPKDAEITGAMGVWISGFFGSGKSHFLKILSYLLANRAVSQGGMTKRALDFFDGKFADTLLAGDVRRAVQLSGESADVLLFNIDSKANTADGRAAILNVFLRVFNELAGYSGDHPHVAAIERRLDEDGKLAEFQAAFLEEYGESWASQRDAYGFVADQFASAASRVTGQSVESCRLMLENENVVVSPENFAKWVRAYLDRRGPGHRIFFLVDEIGQFIGGDTHLMLSLQTITENLGTTCGGRAWVIVTSQENIDAVLGDVPATKANDFSKIQGRFATRLSLSSSNTDEVIQKRLLLKTPAAQELLNGIYAQKGDALRHQTRFQDVGETYASLDSARSFADNYPFLPYQFSLLQRVFEQIRKHGATGLHLSRGERSMLDAFKNAAEALGEQAPDLLVPLHRFYPSIESFLDTSIKRTIDQADGRGLDSFEVDLLRTLFLIRYVDKFKGNLENLTTLCLDQIDADRIALRGHIEAALTRLENETLVGRNGEEWFFLTNEERDVSREIKDVELVQSEETRKLSELIFEGVWKGQTKHRYSGNKKDFGFNRALDGVPFKAELEANELRLKIVSPLHEEFELYSDSRCVLESSQDHSLVLRLGADDKLRAELRTFLKTAKYVARRSDIGLPETTQRILRERAEENRARDRRLGEMAKAAVENAASFADGQTKSPSASGAELRLAELLEDLIKNSFPKLSLLAHLKPNPQIELGPTLRASDVSQLALEMGQTEANPLALVEVREHIGRLHRANQTIILDELVKRFERRPYGWPEWETVLMTARLLRVGEVSLVVEGATVTPDNALDTLNRPTRWRGAVLQQRKTLDVAALRQARTLGNTLFARMGPESEGDLAPFLREHLEKWHIELARFASLAEGGQFPGGAPSQKGLQILKPLLLKGDSSAFIEEFLRLESALKDLEEDFDELAQFHLSQSETWKRLRAALAEFAPNETDLNGDPAAQGALRQLREIAEDARPYGKIRLLDGLIGSVRSVNETLIENARTTAREAVGRAVSQIEGELDAAGIASPARAAYLAPLRDLETQIGSARAVGNIFLAQSRSDGAKDAALKKLEADLMAVTPPLRTSSGPDSVVTPAPKPRHVIAPKNLVSGTYLQSEGEVRDFISALESQLLEAIARGERIEIR